MAFDIINWMTEHGRPEYEAQIRTLESERDEKVAEAGPNGKFCAYLAADLKKIDNDIEEIRQRAQDRYDDWASDWA